jgi:hypothetical protein
MRTQRREFSIGVQLEIVRRATDEDGRVKCERCGIWCKSREAFEIDHVISEGVRPAADKKRRLTAADGQLLCIADHKAKTANDKGVQAEAVRREAAAAGLERPGKGKFGREKKPKAPLTKVALGPPGIARRYQ